MNVMLDAPPLLPSASQKPEGAAPKPKRLSAARESLSLARFGSRPSALSANAIVQAAMSDIRAKGWNARLATDKLLHKRDPALYAKPESKVQSYAFLPLHVRKSADHLTLIALAISQNAEASGAKTAQTVMIYRDVGVLRAALALAAERVGAQQE